jgi:hypothetical protein
MLTGKRIGAGANRREYTREDTRALAARIAERITIKELGERFYPDWIPSKSCKSPFRDERNASFSVSKDYKKFYDFGCSDYRGDVFSFYRIATGCDARQAFKDLKAMAGLSDDDVTTQRRIHVPDFDLGPIRHMPELSWPSDEDLETIAEMRGIEADALRIAVKRGLLRTAMLKDQAAWVLTDCTKYSYLARRMDGQVWNHLKSQPKAWLLRGSRGNWPIGIKEAADSPAIALTEGGPDFLAVFGHALASGVEDLVAPVGMASAAGYIVDEALRYFAGKRVRIFVHDDDAGHSAAVNWADQLKGIAAKVDGYRFDGLVRTDGEPVGDLNDLLLIDYDCWEANRQTVESVVDFANMEGRN